MALVMRLKTVFTICVIILVMMNCLAARSKSDRNNRKGRGQLVSVFFKTDFRPIINSFLLMREVAYISLTFHYGCLIEFCLCLIS